MKNNKKLYFRQRVAARIVTHPGKLFFVMAAIVFTSLFGLTQISISTSYKDVVQKDNLYLKQFEYIEKNYEQSPTLMFVLAPSEKDVFNWVTLDLIHQLTELSLTLPNAIRVDSLTSYDRSYAHGDTLFVKPLVDFKNTRTSNLTDIKEIALGDEFILNRLISDNGKTAAVFVNFYLPESNKVASLPKIIHNARSIQAQLRQAFPDHQIHLSGELVLEQVLLEIAQNDTSQLMTLVLIIGFTVLLILLRSFLAVLMAWLIMSLSLVCTLGVAGWLGFTINNISATAPLTIMIIAIADVIHIVTPFLIKLRQGEQRFKAVEQSIAENLVPISLTSLTTALGFVALNFSGSPAFKDYGNLVAMGVLFAFLLTLFLLPTLMLKLPFRPKKEPLALTQIVNKISSFSIKHTSLNLYWPILLALIALRLLPSIEFNDDLAQYIDKRLPFRQAVEFTNKNLVGYQNLLYSLNSGVAGGVNNPIFLNQIDQFTDWLRQQPGVTNVSSYLEVTKRLNQSMHGDNLRWYQIPSSSDLAAQYLLLYEMSLPIGKTLTADINFDRSEVLLKVSLSQLSNTELMQLEQNAKTWLQQNAPSILSIGTGQSIVIADSNQQMIADLLDSSIVLILAITFIILIGLKSFKLGALSILPNLLPAIIVYGVWSLMVKQVNAAAALVFSISLGLVVDDTIHFLTKYQEGRLKSLSAEKSVDYAFQRCGSALIVTTFCLSAGILVLTQSLFGPNVTTALLLVPIILLALVLDLLFLPALLIKSSGWSAFVKGILIPRIQMQSFRFKT